MDLYIHKDGQNIGPLNPAQAYQGLFEGRFQVDDQAITRGTNEWKPLQEVLQLLENQAATPLQDHSQESLQPSGQLLPVTQTSPSIPSPFPSQVATIANVVTPTIMCSVHAERPAAGACAYSGKFYCQEDLVVIEGRQYGRENLGFVMAEVKENASKGSTPQVFMNAGGGGGGSSSSSSAAAAAVAAPFLPLSEEVSPYSRETALLCCAAGVFGIAGIHRFYTGHYGTGAAMFVTMGGCWLWTIADLLALLTRTYRDAQGRLLK